MIWIDVRRRYKGIAYTIGDLFVNGVKFCETLEDRDRGLSQYMSIEEIQRRKVYGETAIPEGVYFLDLETISMKFKDREWAKPYDGKIPRLSGVPGFDGVLIHPGNTAKDTLGCILLGWNKVKGQVIESQITWKKFMDEVILPAKRNGDGVILKIQ